MKKTANYIIKKSLDIASISNSDTISYTDKLQLLNDTFTQLYQWSINAGEKNWIREVYLVGNGGKYQLPSDFYQLEQIYMNDEEYFGNYEIVNGYINIKTMIGRCKMRYFTRPVYLSFPNTTLDSYINYEGTIRHANGIYFITTEDVDKGGGSHDTIVRIYDIEREDVVCTKLFEDDEFDHVYLYRNSFWIPDDNDVYFYDFEGNEVSHLEMSMEVTNDPVADFCFLDDQTMSFHNAFGQSLFTLPEGFTVASWFLLYREEIGTILFFADDKVYIIDTDQGTMTEMSPGWTVGLIPYDLGYFNENLCIYCYQQNSITNRAVVMADGKVFWDKLDTPKIPMNIYGLKVDEETGYGLLIVNGDKSMRVQSFVPDTEFNAPNNMFYSLLLYKLAQAYCTKLNVENTRLDETVMEMEHTYFDTLKTNISKYGVIKDVYERRFI